MDSYIKEHIALHEKLSAKLLEEPYISSIRIMAEQVIACFERGGKILVCGNGGSAADAQHIAAEFVVRFETTRKALPAIALNANSSSLTAIGNDLSADEIFARQVEAFGKPEDLLWAISTSGNSENVILAMDCAKNIGMPIISSIGRDGGKMHDLADADIVVPCDTTSYIQEMHIMIAHIICGLVDMHYK